MGQYPEAGLCHLYHCTSGVHLIEVQDAICLTAWLRKWKCQSLSYLISPIKLWEADVSNLKVDLIYILCLKIANPRKNFTMPLLYTFYMFWCVLNWLVLALRSSCRTFKKEMEKEMATHSSVLAWRIPGTGKPGGLPSMGSHRVGHHWSDLAVAALRSSCIIWVKKNKFISVAGQNKSGNTRWVSNM